MSNAQLEVNGTIGLSGRRLDEKRPLPAGESAGAGAFANGANLPSLTLSLRNQPWSFAFAVSHRRYEVSRLYAVNGTIGLSGRRLDEKRQRQRDAPSLQLQFALTASVVFISLGKGGKRGRLRHSTQTKAEVPWLWPLATIRLGRWLVPIDTDRSFTCLAEMHVVSLRVKLHRWAPGLEADGDKAVAVPGDMADQRRGAVLEDLVACHLALLPCTSASDMADQRLGAVLEVAACVQGQMPEVLENRIKASVHRSVDRCTSQDLSQATGNRAWVMALVELVESQPESRRFQNEAFIFAAWEDEEAGADPIVALTTGHTNNFVDSWRSWIGDLWGLQKWSLHGYHVGIGKCRMKQCGRFPVHAAQEPVLTSASLSCLLQRFVQVGRLPGRGVPAHWRFPGMQDTLGCLWRNGDASRAFRR
ncbi:hypothetical protein AK812_SmicGene29143 [Symbiodinium microadriaticum]|uniref:Uncharacterized protein n=1 Tax=Symbiodinium microadriaticum TaxID=2951 RepID=A0A1Q9D2L9_SYMMI|nr:hypothetical protein AK812_SmicGene29143 [Symbiodinium microadriaticum]